jgi:hypothetical protein
MTTATILFINTGTSANAGDGDSLRTAFFKVNQNFQLLGATTGFSSDAVKDSVAPMFTTGNDAGIQFLYNSTDHVMNVSLTTATETTIGGVKIGAGISITRDGTISAATAYVLPTASNVVLGGVRVGTGLSVDQYGVLSNFGVTTFNGRRGPVTLSSTDVSTALGFPPVSSFLVGSANGLATLDGSGKIPVGELPDTVLGALNYLGTWNARDNLPPIVAGVGAKGSYYRVSVAGTTDIAGLNVWNVGDWIIFNGATWDKLDGILSEVTSVAGRTGDVVINYSDVHGQLTQSSVFSATVTATNISLGVIKLGAGILASEDGTISIDTRSVSTATTASLGLVKIGNGISITADGTISAASSNSIQDITFNINQIGTANLNEDLILQPRSGNVIIKNTIITEGGNNALVLRTNQFLNAGLATDATNFSLRLVGDSNAGTTLFDAGVYNSPIATTGWTSKFLLTKTGNATLAGNLTVRGANGITFSDGSTQLTAAVISTATNASVGGIIVGNGLAIDGLGVLSTVLGTSGGQITDLGATSITSSFSPGNPGEVAYDGTYFYLCVATNKWIRIAMTPADVPGAW